ncbi:hypothetical protein ACFOSD_00940 [Salinispirillum marinum]|uniref:PAS domain-containing protein n=2 Tax=Saccharospirillaceae TaxID=255527 RepID=A0ABV8BD06_9GAMM
MSTASVLWMLQPSAATEPLARHLTALSCPVFTALQESVALNIIERQTVGVLVTGHPQKPQLSQEFFHTVRQQAPWLSHVVINESDQKTVPETLPVYAALTSPIAGDYLLSALEGAMAYYDLQARHHRLSDELLHVEHTLLTHHAQHAQATQLPPILAANALLDALPVGVLQISEEGVVLEANALATQWLGAHTPIVGTKARKILPEGLLDLPLSEGAHCLIGKVPCFAIHTRSSTKRQATQHLLTLIPHRA